MNMGYTVLPLPRRMTFRRDRCHLGLEAAAHPDHNSSLRQLVASKQTKVGSWKLQLDQRTAAEYLQMSLLRVYLHSMQLRTFAV